MLKITGDTTVYRGDTLCPSDTCAVIAAPDSIEGYLSGVCGSTGESYSITPVTGATSYKWTVNDTALASVNSPDNLSSVSVDFSDSVSEVMLTAEAKSTCASSSRSIIIYGGPLSPGVISGSDAICSGGVEEYTIEGSHGATYYTWTVPSGSTILGGQGTGSIIVLFGSVSGYITVNASNDCDTSDADSLNVTVNSCRQAQQAYLDKGLRAYPNPTIGIVTLLFGAVEEKKYELQLSDITGNILNTINVTSVKGLNSIDLNLVHYSKGIYLIKLNTSDHSEVIRISLQ